MVAHREIDPLERVKDLIASRIPKQCQIAKCFFRGGDRKAQMMKGKVAEIECGGLAESDTSISHVVFLPISSTNSPTFFRLPISDAENFIPKAFETARTRRM